MKEIQLTNGRIAFCDDEDYERLLAYTWEYKRQGSCEYARGRKRHGRFGLRRGVVKPRPKIYMHHVVTNTIGKRIRFDHQDGNGLNNQKHNLRRCTHAQNMYNMRPPLGRKYKGVHEYWPGCWQAVLVHGKEKIHHGGFRSIEDAAREYNRLALEHFGKFARLNEVE